MGGEIFFEGVKQLTLSSPSVFGFPVDLGLPLVQAGIG